MDKPGPLMSSKPLAKPDIKLSGSKAVRVGIHELSLSGGPKRDSVSFGHRGLSSAQNLYLRATSTRSVANLLHVIEDPEERGFFCYRSANIDVPRVVFYSRLRANERPETQLSRVIRPGG